MVAGVSASSFKKCTPRVEVPDMRLFSAFRDLYAVGAAARPCRKHTPARVHALDDEDAILTAFLKHREEEPNREAAFVDALWALINTREFILNH